MKVLLTGADGYIGVRMGNYLMQRGHDVTGLDSGFHRVGWMYNSDELRRPCITKDTRDDHRGRPRGLRRRRPPRRGLQRPRRRAEPGRHLPDQPPGHAWASPSGQEAGVQRFVHMSSLQRLRRLRRRRQQEGDPDRPAHRYAKCKVLVEQRSARWPTTTSRRRSCATPRPSAPRPASASTSSSTTSPPPPTSTSEIRMASDGTPWRPFVHILDISHAVGLRRSTRRATSCTTRSSTSAATTQNYQIRQIAEIIGDLVPGLRAHRSATRTADARNYRATSQDPRAAARLPVRVGRRARAPRSSSTSSTAIGFDEELYRFRGHTRHQADQAPARHRPDRRRLLLDVDRVKFTRLADRRRVPSSSSSRTATTVASSPGPGARTSSPTHGLRRRTSHR